MKKQNGSRFSQAISKFFNMIMSCSRPTTTTCTLPTPSLSNRFRISTPPIRRSKIYLSPRRINRMHHQSPSRPTTLISFDQTRQKETTSSSSSLSSSTSLSASSSTSNCHSSLTIHQCYSTSTVPSATTANIEIVNNRMDDTTVKSSNSPPPTSSGFSYLIRPSTPCIFGGGEYDEQQDDDEFFVTAGGIVHSCPNIYELTNDHQRKLQSCDHLMFFNQPTAFIDDQKDQMLNCYDTEFDRYSILPRFQAFSTISMSTDSINSELELYRERHAAGLSRQNQDNISPYSASLLPTTWKSDNYLLFMPLIDPNFRLFNAIEHGKRSRSHDIPFDQTCSSVMV